MLNATTAAPWLGLVALSTYEDPTMFLRNPETETAFSIRESLGQCKIIGKTRLD